MKSTPLLAAMVLALSNPLYAQNAAPFTVETNFPGGNAIVDSIDGDTVKITPDLRTTTQPWFYWNIAVKGAEGHTLNFLTKAVGVRGPGVSLDDGQTWKWLGPESITDTGFTYAVPAGAKEVRLSSGMPYVASNFQKFIEKYKGNPDVKLETLTKSGKDRDVTLLKIGKPGAKYAVAITCRHHACEMVASYVVEGIIAGVMADDPAGKWLRENVSFFIVPFADTDGVEDGDQGKNRAPHDHNRDYGDETIYSEVAAIKAKVPEWSAGRPLVFMDIHDPALKGDVHEIVYFLEAQEPAHQEALKVFMKSLEDLSQGPIILRQGNVMKFGTVYNGQMAVPPLISAGWARTLPNCLLGFTLEMPYANASGFEVNQDSARDTGRDVALALAGLLQEESKKGAK